MGQLLKQKTVGLAIFSYKAPHTLSETLASYKKSGLLDFFDDICLFFIGSTPKDEEVANTYHLRFIATSEEIGVKGAISCMVANMQTDYILLVEHDCAVWNTATSEQLGMRLNDALGVLERDAADMIRLRHSWIRNHQSTAASTYSWFYQIDQLSSFWKHAENLSEAQPWIKWVRRMLHPFRAQRWIGRSVYVEENPHLKFPRYIHKDGHIFIVDSAVFHWTNQPSLFPREFLIKSMEQIATHHAMSDSSSKEALEKSINGHLWRKAHYRIGVAKGIFT
ncbi:MAG: hypothetical protein RSE01_02785 [Akkermansia sp.]